MDLNFLLPPKFGDYCHAAYSVWLRPLLAPAALY